VVELCVLRRLTPLISSPNNSRLRRSLSREAALDAAANKGWNALLAGYQAF
jgi:hypothetical protein